MVNKEHSSHKTMPMIRKINWRLILISTVLAALSIAIGYQLNKHTNEARLVQKLQIQTKQLDIKLKELDKQKTTTKQIDDQRKALEVEKAKLIKDLEAKRSTPKVYAESNVEPAVAVVKGCGDNQYAQFIYQHESGCNLNSVNSIGCKGIGQSCGHANYTCGADYACQNAWFTNYANQKYGGWYQAYLAWQNQGWW